MRFNFENKIVVIIGGGSGIGKVIVEIFVEMGVIVYIIDRFVDVGYYMVVEIF